MLVKDYQTAEDAIKFAQGAPKTEKSANEISKIRLDCKTKQYFIDLKREFNKDNKPVKTINYK